MNLKEAFRYQNKIQRLMDDAHSILSRDRNITKVENTHLRHKVMAEVEDETTVDTPDTEYAEQITNVAILLMYLLDLREKLSAAILAAKRIFDVTCNVKDAFLECRKRTRAVDPPDLSDACCAVGNGGAVFVENYFCLRAFKLHNSAFLCFSEKYSVKLSHFHKSRCNFPIL